MTEQDAKPLQILIGQFRENVEIDSVVPEHLGVTLKAELAKPIIYRLHRRATSTTPFTRRRFTSIFGSSTRA
jgi:hypothetical protein